MDDNLYREREGPIYVMDKVGDFVEDNCYALNCILKLFIRPGLFPKESFNSRQE